eukprot:Lankesteria_metandrocarpae@DN1445_c0_g1_i1.p1
MGWISRVLNAFQFDEITDPSSYASVGAIVKNTIRTSMAFVPINDLSAVIIAADSLYDAVHCYYYKRKYAHEEGSLKEFYCAPVIRVIPAYEPHARFHTRSGIIEGVEIEAGENASFTDGSRGGYCSLAIVQLSADVFDTFDPTNITKVELL